MIENELVYLVKRMPDLASATSKEIAQHYLSDESTLRIRASGGNFELTKKILIDNNDSTRKEEINIPLTESEYRAFLPLAKRGLEKTRWHLPLPGDAGLVAELNVYKGALEGLVMVEVEFPDDATRAAFVPPDWFGRDVSSEDWSGNPWLAGKSFADIRALIV